jgi:uncharacterized circularly permuted ATP-grasp superfamily protein/uncharacterized alpha-E superfamily protein
MSETVGGYRAATRAGGGQDEMYTIDGTVRAAWAGVGETLDELGPPGLAERRRAIERYLEDDGVHYRPLDSKADQPWLLDPVPLLIDEPEWAALEPGLIQRAELLDEILTDIYGARRLIKDRLLPPSVVFAHAGFLRDADGIRIPGARQLFLAAADLARDGDGRWRVLADRAQAPSGAGYAMENRSVLSRAMPGMYRSTGVHRIAPFFHTLRQSLQRIAPARARDTPPRAVLLSPGADSETAFDQAFTSSLTGLPLTTGSDLTVRGGRVWQHSIGGLQPVDVILRRLDDRYCDPLDLRGNSQLGVPALVEAARRGAVSIVNGLGTGVLENPGLFPFLPALCRELRGQDLLLESVHTWWCGDPVARQHVVSRLKTLVIKPLARDVGHSARLGWDLSERELATLAARIESEPYGWVAQEPLAMSTAPTWHRSRLEPRPVVLRTFGVASGDTYQLMTGGLTRVPTAAGALLVSNSSGAISKDVWVISSTVELGDDVVRDGLVGPETVSAAVSPRVAADLFWLGRYAERVESVARLLRVVDLRWRDLHPAPDPALATCVVTLLETLTSVTTTWPGFVGDGAGTRLSAPRTELLSLISDEHRIGSLAHDLGRLRALANSVRDQLSADTWSMLSGLDRSLVEVSPAGAAQSPVALSDDLSSGLARLLQATLAFSGLVAESMVRDAGWYLLDAGRRLERSLQIVGLLRHSLNRAPAPAAQSLVVESVLIAAESIITHRRRYQARGGIDTVLELLLLDGGNPRSLTFQLDRIAADLGETPTSSEATDKAAAVLETIRQRLHFADLVELSAVEGAHRPDLEAMLDRTAMDLRELYRCIESTHFAQPGTLRPLALTLEAV